MRNNFPEIYFLAIDREVLAEQQIERENVKRSGANGEKQIRGPVEARNFFAARKRVRVIPAVASPCLTLFAPEASLSRGKDR